MRKIKEVLRLRFELGLGLRAIARSCSIGLGTAHEYLHQRWRCKQDAVLRQQHKAGEKLFVDWAGDTIPYS